MYSVSTLYDLPDDAKDKKNRSLLSEEKMMRRLSSRIDAMIEKNPNDRIISFPISGVRERIEDFNI
jgi:hypothetical protein